MADGDSGSGRVIAGAQQPASGQDPIRVMMGIAKDPDIVVADKTELIAYTALGRCCCRWWSCWGWP